MAHFAELGVDDRVLRVIVVANDKNLDADGNENELFGAKFCRDLSAELGGRQVITILFEKICRNRLYLRFRKRCFYSSETF